MTEQDFSKWKQLLLRATVLLNKKKDLGLSFANARPYYYDSTKSIYGLKTEIMSLAFDRPGHATEELLPWSYFDPQQRVVHIDDYADYGNLSGDDKVVARLAFWLYCLCLGGGWYATGRRKLVNKKPLEWRNEHGIS
jgi:hypothetical protein